MSQLFEIMYNHNNEPLVLYTPLLKKQKLAQKLNKIKLFLKIKYKWYTSIYKSYVNLLFFSKLTGPSLKEEHSIQSVDKSKTVPSYGFYIFGELF